jgi:hypothetical protein
MIGNNVSGLFEPPLQLDNFCTHVTLPTLGCQEDDQLFKAVTL